VTRQPNQPPRTTHNQRSTKPEENDRPPLVRININLTAVADRALTTLATTQGLSKTDTINRALQVAAALHAIAPNGHLTIRQPDGTHTDIYIL